MDFRFTWFCRAQCLSDRGLGPRDGSLGEEKGRRYHIVVYSVQTSVRHLHAQRTEASADLRKRRCKRGSVQASKEIEQASKEASKHASKRSEPESIQRELFCGRLFGALLPRQSHGVLVRKASMLNHEIQVSRRVMCMSWQEHPRCLLEIATPLQKSQICIFLFQSASE